MSLKLEKISINVGRETHIHDTNLTLEKGSMNVLLGRTLSGKTTLMRIMAGLDVPTTGKIYWDGKDVTGMPVRERKIAMVYQQFINYPSFTVYENIAVPLKLMKKSKAEIDKAVKETAALMRLDNVLNRRPLELSGGQQQRCALARSLVKGSNLVLLDEPLANLDYKLREELREEIPKIFEKSNAIFVYATTEPEEALLLGGRVATLWEGKVTQFDKTGEVYHKPNNLKTARVFSNPSMNFLTIRKEGNTFYYGRNQKATATNQITKLADGEYLVGFRPNHLALKKSSNTKDIIELPVQLNVTEMTGAETFLHMYYEEFHENKQKRNHWVALAHGVYELEYNSKMTVYLNTRHIFIFQKNGNTIETAPYVSER